MPRKKSTKVYFTQDTQDAIVEYNNTNDCILKNRLYETRIKYPFEKLAEIVYNKWGFTYFDDSPADVMAEVVGYLVEKMYMYKPSNGKAYSYFTIIARNYLILNNNSNYKRYKETDLISNLNANWDVENNWEEESINTEYRIFNERMLQYWDTHLDAFFNKKRDKQIADAILELFRRVNYIENFNKKALYLLIREMTGYPTHYITKVVNKMKDKQLQLLNEYIEYGDIRL